MILVIGDWFRSRFGSTQEKGRRQAIEGTTDPGLAPGARTASVLHDEQTRRFRQVVSVVRALTTAIALVLASSSLVDHGADMIAWTVVVTVYHLFRLAVPLQGDADTVSIVKLLVEVALGTLATVFTGAWSSPLVFTLLPAIIVAGFGRGIWPALRISLATAMTVSVVHVSTASGSGQVWVTNLQWTLFLVLVGVMAGYARNILGEARTTHSLTMTRVADLTDANRLLTSLHSVTQVLPASLDLEEVLDTTIARLRGLFSYDAAVVLLLDRTDDSWRVARWDGHRLDGALEPTQLPRVLHGVRVDRSVRRFGSLISRAGGGLVPNMESGLYGAMVARDEFIGLLALETRDGSAYDEAAVELLKGFLEPASLAIANAQVFERLRTVGADEERSRIARDLHDRIGQSLAYIAFEMDRLVRSHEQGRDLGPSLGHLRDDVRGVIGEVRDTLYDLRTDVSEDQDLAETMALFVERVRERSGLEVLLRTKVDGRLPLLQERELWRIAQEAVMNVERHARAHKALITWQSDGASALLEVQDDGIGFPEEKAGRMDSYGILGMRERAASVGATLQIMAAPGRGTVVRCRLDTR